MSSVMTEITPLPVADPSADLPPRAEGEPISLGMRVASLLAVIVPFVGLVASVPARVQFKLLAAFLAIATLLIIVGAVGLQVLRGVNQRTEEQNVGSRAQRHPHVRHS